MQRQQQVLAQHHDLDYAMDRLNLLANAPIDLLSQDRLRYILEREFRKLSKSVISHFQYEEKNGYMSEVVLNAPHLASKIEKLVEEHNVLSKMFSDLVTKSYEDGAIEEFRDCIKIAIEAIRRHEQSENDVLQSYLVDELGTLGS